MILLLHYFSQTLFFGSTMRHMADCPWAGTPPPTLCGESSVQESRRQCCWWDSTFPMVTIFKWSTDSYKAVLQSTRGLFSGKDLFLSVMSLMSGQRVESLSLAMFVSVREPQGCSWQFDSMYICAYWVISMTYFHVLLYLLNPESSAEWLASMIFHNEGAMEYFQVSSLCMALKVRI